MRCCGVEVIRRCILDTPQNHASNGTKVSCTEVRCKKRFISLFFFLRRHNFLLLFPRDENISGLGAVLSQVCEKKVEVIHFVCCRDL